MTNTGNERLGKPDSLTAWLRQVAEPVTTGGARLLARLGVTPNMLTVLGPVTGAVAGYFAARGAFGWAAVVLVVGLPADAFDGALARLTGRVSPAGALLDSTFDRYAEFFVLAGLAYHFGAVGDGVAVLLTFVTLFGSVMVSYLRARSEGVGVDNKVGLMTRVERILVLLAALLSGYVVAGLWVLAVLTHVTVAQRIWYALRILRARAGEEPQ